MARYQSAAQKIDNDAGASVAVRFDDKEEQWSLRILRKHHGNVRASAIDPHFLLSSDYKVLVIAVDELHVSQVLNQRIADSGDELKLDDAVKIVGCWNGLGKHVAAEDGMDISADPQAMRTAIAFAQSIKHSKLLTAAENKHPR